MSDAAVPEPAVPPSDLVRSPLSDGEWHRMHPLTPLMRGGLFLLVVGGIIVANMRDRLVAVFLPWLLPDSSEDFSDFGGGDDPVDFVIANNLYLVALVVVLGVLAVLVSGFYLSWRFHSFRITGDDVEVRRGILNRTQRRAPLDRVQGVNLTRPMIARIFGMAKLEVVGAGADANVKLEYLSTANAEAVRADILRLASGRRLGSSAAGSGDGSAAPAAGLGRTVGRGVTGLIAGDEPEVEEPESVVHIPVGRIIGSHILSTSTLWLIAALTAIVIGVVNSTPWLLFGFVPAIIGFAAFWFRSITRSLRYSIAPTPDGVRITFGLLTTITEIVPPGRVHAIEVSQSILWRPAGWWTVTVNRLSGSAGGDGNSEQFATVLPVGTRDDVEQVLRLLLPDLPESAWPEVFRHGILGPQTDDPYTNTPGRARLLRPLSWRRNGLLATPDALLLRRGVVWRQLSVLPLARLQSIGVSQGPLARAIRVAGIRAHTIPGRVSTTIGAIDRDAALRVFADVESGVLAAAAADHTHRWAGEAGEDAGR
ncbi:PH domain-containing protein [Microbacterium thalassium]|uniref:Putative membrane protein n=1 Tax=Microbacterium thalassium TaxID=362649 RepID=A0A7X0FMR5_9MICO|nr:PH domain-containing protein [Microbacterium thalassium]MBB6389905.1 putative membrane protein [Microbacterium thalassium]GLK24592.1 hypothetical protein GCM10017607_19100 [Microbacterium thalassium]